MIPDYSDIARLPKVEKAVDCVIQKKDVVPEISTDVNEDSLEVVQCLADRGQLSVALDRCRKYLENHPESAEGYCLQGIIELANETDASATESFRKALYIDPNHYYALIHLSVLAEEQGNVDAAENYRARADRVDHA